jgi:hypothetical protein
MWNKSENTVRPLELRVGELTRVLEITGGAPLLDN